MRPRRWHLQDQHLRRSLRTAEDAAIRPFRVNVPKAAPRGPPSAARGDALAH